MLNNLITRLICFLLVSLSPFARADLYSATLAYQNEDFTTAYQQFKRLAQFGNADAMFNLGVMHLYGQGIEKSITDAFIWLSLASEFGIEEASQTAHLVFQQSSSPKQLKAALKARKAQLQATYALTPTLSLLAHKPSPSVLTKIHDVQPDYPQEAVRQGIEGWVWLEFDVDGSGKATNIEVIDSYPKHVFTASLLNAVEKWRYSGQKQNHTLIYHFTTYKGKQYKETLATQKKSYESELKQSISAAEQGIAQVQYKIANWLSMKDYNAYQLLRYHWRSEYPANDLLLAAAKNGSPLAQYRIANRLLNTQANTLATLWLEHASETINVAKYRLATVLLEKNNTVSRAKAIKLLEESASEGHLRSIIALVNTHFSDTKRLSQATIWLEKGLQVDAKHPHLLFLSAKLAPSNEQAKTLATQALNSAKARNWNTQEISTFLNALNKTNETVKSDSD